MEAFCVGISHTELLPVVEERKKYPLHELTHRGREAP